MLTNALDQRRGFFPETIRPESSQDGKILAQNPSSRPRQAQEELPTGKKKSLHEYGPEQLIPEPEDNTRSTPNTRSRPERVPTPQVQSPAPQSKSNNKKQTPIFSRSKAESVPTPEAQSTPGIDLKPSAPSAPVESTAPLTTVPAIEPPPETRPDLRSETRKEESGLGFYWKLVLCIALFVVVLSVLVFVVREMMRHLKAEAKKEPERKAEIWKPRARPEGQAVSDSRAEHSEKVMPELKNRAG
ncbi:MAG TPA: hypothetical protein VJ302_20150 [Blastocatellia bacterium]|nr:hypothetical protein [Blastocatellia bacterium]